MEHISRRSPPQLSPWILWTLGILADKGACNPQRSWSEFGELLSNHDCTAPREWAHHTLCLPSPQLLLPNVILRIPSTVLAHRMLPHQLNQLSPKKFLNGLSHFLMALGIYPKTSALLYLDNAGRWPCLSTHSSGNRCIAPLLLTALKNKQPSNLSRMGPREDPESNPLTLLSTLNEASEKI